jgi:hypothetical protein
LADPRERREEKRRDCAAARRAFEWHRDLRKEFCAKEPTRKRDRERGVRKAGKRNKGFKVGEEREAKEWRRSEINTLVNFYFYFCIGNSSGPFIP